MKRRRKKKSSKVTNGASPKRTKRPVAVFDVDGTIFRSSLAIELLEQLIQKGVFPRSAARGYERELLRWRERKGTYEEYIDKVVAVLWGHLKGIKPGVVVRAANEVLESKRRYTYRYTRDLALDLKRKGYFLLAISHSPRIILAEFAKRFGFDAAYGSLADIDDAGRLTGHAKDFHILKNKGGILERAVEKYGLTLKGSVGVGDTESDISFLKMVKKPICFNPNLKLFREATRQGWKVVVERKDVIYDAVRVTKTKST